MFKPTLNTPDTAPKDGSVIIWVHTDGSGVEAASFVECTDGAHRWCDVDEGNVLFDEGEVSELAGWFYPPETIKWLYHEKEAV